MMWILVEQKYNSSHKRFIGAKNYDTLIKYINTFDDVRKKDDYHFETHDVEFIIQMCEVIEWREQKYDKHQKGKKARNL